jgi:hypothetical protein
MSATTTVAIATEPLSLDRTAPAPAQPPASPPADAATVDAVVYSVRESCLDRSMDARRRGVTIDFGSINRVAVPMLPTLCQRWLPGGKFIGREYVVRNPRRNDRRPGSFSVNVRTGRWADFAAGDKGGDVVSLAAFTFNLEQSEAARRLAKMLNIPETVR